MQQLINLITEKTGISQEQAQGAVESIVSFLKDKLPFGLGDHLDNALNDNGEGEGLLDKAGDLIGGFFGGNEGESEATSDEESSEEESSEEESA